LEVFTRFGARLEATMEAAIRRGRMLREILKQERLSPLPAVFQMAWLVAFNDGLFEGVEPDDIPVLLMELENPIRQKTLNLDSPREEWRAAVTHWLSRPMRDTST
jgi:F-type H+-transporting ATPase subunit alpha